MSPNHLSFTARLGPGSLLCTVAALQLGTGLFFAVDAAAEIFTCNGVYQSTPCSTDAGKAAPSFSRAEAAGAAAEGAEPSTRSTRMSLFHELTMQSIEAKQRYGLKFDISAEEAACTDPDATLERCSRAVRQAEDTLETRLKGLRLIESQEEANRLQEEANRRKEEEAANNTAVVIDNSPNYIYRRDRHWHHDGHGHPHGGYGSGWEISAELSGTGKYDDSNFAIRGGSPVTSGPRPLPLDPRIDAPRPDSPHVDTPRSHQRRSHRDALDGSRSGSAGGSMIAVPRSGVSQSGSNRGTRNRSRSSALGTAEGSGSVTR